MSKLILSQAKIAIVHDWLIGGGTERVVLELHQMFPNAPVYTSYCSKEWRDKLDGKVVTGYLQQWPLSRLRKFLPLLRILWFTRLKFTGYDLVISSSGNGEAKGIHVPKGTVHVCYCHSPTHFYWRHYEQYMQQPGFGLFNPLARIGLRLLVGPLRRWDLRASQRPDYYIANSTHIQADIKKFYGRDSTVIFPPVDMERFATSSATPPLLRAGFITVGRQVAYKHIDVVVEACTKLSLPLTVVGRGPEHEHLRQLAGPTIVFAPPASDEDVVRYMHSAEAFLFAAFEDFGVTEVEALASGTPVIAYKAGGAIDYVIPQKTGEFFTSQTAEALAKVLENYTPSRYDPTAIAEFAQKFSIQNFIRDMSSFLQTIMDSVKG